MEGASVTEATTQILGAPTKTTNSQQPFNYATAEPAHLSSRASTAAVQTMPTTQHLDAPRRQRNVLWLSLAAVGVLITFVVALLAMWYSARPMGIPRPPVVVVAPPTTIPAPPLMPPPPGMQGTVSREFFYPGAKVEQTIVISGEPQMVRLSTPDAFSKVIKWYESKFNPSEKVIMPDANAVLRIGSSSIIITAGDDGTNIMLA
ncbi:MAG: hypothetical protein M3R15_19445, partial [Acidobacteriota bacterium]|nr:hypothetical protein [Acidobacteriota bacterium]